MKTIYKKLILANVIFFINGCASLGKGVTEAILEKQQSEDTRLCEIRGDAFEGLKPHLEIADSKMKVLMVHGVGEHLPGYSTEFFEKLAIALDLTVTAKQYKNISLTDPTDTEKKLGNLRVNRFLNKEQTQELLFYELTWSEITAKEKQVLAYDNSGEFSFRRAEVNNLLKKFSNDTGPDPIIYLGESREDILIAFGQSFCWMTGGDWDDLPDHVHQACKSQNIESIYKDSYAFVSHSLGSRITIDGLQRIASLPGKEKVNKNYLALVAALKNKEIPIYMMSNQLPMLQLGRKLPEKNHQKNAYCKVEGNNYADRMLAKTPIIAFSDPNDILSYSIP